MSVGSTLNLAFLCQHQSAAWIRVYILTSPCLALIVQSRIRVILWIFIPKMRLTRLQQWKSVGGTIFSGFMIVSVWFSNCLQNLIHWKEGKRYCSVSSNSFSLWFMFRIKRSALFYREIDQKKGGAPPKHRGKWGGSGNTFSLTPGWSNWK